MVETERPHFRSSAGASSELFICFTSRLSSSSSMKLSKSILSPGRPPRDGGPLSLSSSLSRRLRTNGSLKGGQASPFFNRKRGCAFDNPEPSSPKVTCIGQVRVKTKKSRGLSKRRSGEVSFRKIEQQQDGDDKVFRYSSGGAPPQRNQRWVHLPISICEALRTFGTEFSCLFPCRSSCEGEKSEKESVNENGCSAVFARWLVSVNDGEGAKRREIELVVGGGDEEEEGCLMSSRRHVFDDFEVRDDRIEVKGRSLEREEGKEEARVSICIPPKNALLLMRCRSDPIKMAALSNNRFSWDNFPQNEDIQEQKEEEEQVEVEEEAVNDGKDEVVLEQEIVSEGADTNDEETHITNEEKLEVEGDKEETEEERLSRSSIISDEEKTELETQTLIVEEEGGEEEEVESNMSSFEALLEQENTLQSEDWCPIQHEEEEEEQHTASISPSTESDTQETINPTANEGESKSKSDAPSLPECLVLMMREPKLSMEVSRETWVCSTDFMRPKHEPVKRRLSIDSKPKPEMPPRSSLIEQKLVNTVAYEPFVLTRCKSEPMRSAAAKLIPDSCYEPRLGLASSYADPTVVII